MAFSATFRPLSAIFLHSYTHSAGQKLFQCVHRSETFSLICNMTIFIRYLRVTHILRCEKGVFGPFWPFFTFRYILNGTKKGWMCLSQWDLFIDIQYAYIYTIPLRILSLRSKIGIVGHFWPFLGHFLNFHNKSFIL